MEKNVTLSEDIISNEISQNEDENQKSEKRNTCEFDSEESGNESGTESNGDKSRMSCSSVKNDKLCDGSPKKRLKTTNAIEQCSQPMFSTPKKMDIPSFSLSLNSQKETSVETDSTVKEERYVNYEQGLEKMRGDLKKYEQDFVQWIKNSDEVRSPNVKRALLQYIQLNNAVNDSQHFISESNSVISKIESSISEASKTVRECDVKIDEQKKYRNECLNDRKVKQEILSSISPQYLELKKQFEEAQHAVDLEQIRLVYVNKEIASAETKKRNANQLIKEGKLKKQNYLNQLNILKQGEKKPINHKLLDSFSDDEEFAKIMAIADQQNANEPSTSASSSIEKQ